MAGINDIPVGLRTVTQVPLDAKGYFVSEAVAKNLGPSNNLAFTYEKGLQIYCALEKSRWEWREPNFPGEVGLRTSLFTYPSSFTVNGINYSNKNYNFYPVSPLSTGSIQELIDTLGLSFYWKRGQIQGTRTSTSLPLGVTNNEYTRNGYVCDNLPLKVDNSLVRDPDDILMEFQIQNLAVEIKKFNLIKDYQPVLIISRYLPSKRKKEIIEEEIVHKFKRAGFKVPLEEDGVRLQKIPINKGYQVIDFGQEHFFKLKRNFECISPEINYSLISTRGVGKKYSNIRFTNDPIGEGGNRDSKYTKHKSFVYLQFQLQVTFDSIIYLSKPLNKIKMEASFYGIINDCFTPGTSISIENHGGYLPTIRFKQT